jgi:soluble lytic murein transglycosylase-like protein
MRLLLLIALMALCTCNLCHAQRENPEADYYVNAYADHYGIPRALMRAIVSQESSWNPTAVSAAGALGLMQLMPKTARAYGVRNPFSKSDNIGGGARYLHYLLQLFHGDMRLAVAAYYTGEGHIARRGLAFHNPAVIAYVEQVQRRYQRELERRNTPASEEPK